MSEVKEDVKDLNKDKSEDSKAPMNSEEATKKKLEAEKEESARKRVPLKQGDYVVQVHVIEARELQPRDAGAMADPVCVVTCMGQKHQTRIHKQCLSTMFDEVIILEFKNVFPAELERSTVTLSVYDARTARKDVLIGLYQFDLSSVYYSKNHEVFRQWAALTDTTDEHEGIQGYLKASVVVLGPGDEQFIHPAADEDDEEGGMLAVLMPPSIEQKGRLLKLQVYEVKDLPKMDDGPLGGSCDPYVRVDFAGLVTRTKHFEGLNVVMNQELQIPVMEPCMSNAITFSLWDWDQGSSDDRICAFRLNYADIADAPMPPTWCVMYGAPALNSSKAGELMNQGYVEGSHYRGRVLLSATVVDDDEPKQNVATVGSLALQQKPAEEQYVIQVDLYEGSEVPDTANFTQGKVRVEVCFGSVSVESSQAEVKAGRAKWYSVLKDLVTPAPKDVKQVPDVFVYLVSDKKRLSFKRFPMETLVARGWEAQPEWVVLGECKALDGLQDDQFPGSVLINLRAGPQSTMPLAVPAVCRPIKNGDFFSSKGPSSSAQASSASSSTSSSASLIQQEQEQEEEEEEEEPVMVSPPAQPRKIPKMGDLTVVVMDGLDLPAFDRNGFSDPYVKLKIEGNKTKSNPVKKTLAPTWNETFYFKSVSIESPLEVQVWDEDNLKDEEMGSSQVDLRTANLEANVPLGTSFEKEVRLLINSKFPSASIRLKLSFKYLAVEESEQQEQKAQATKAKKASSIFTKITNIVTHAEQEEKPSAELGVPAFKEFQLRVHLYMARGLPALDSNGLSDPYCIFRLAGKKIECPRKKETLNPRWFQSFTEMVSLPLPLHLAPHIQCLIMDWDQVGKDESIGRFAVPCSVALAMNPSLDVLTPKWFPITDVEGRVIPEAKILCSFQLLGTEEAARYPTLPSIQPPTTPMYLEIVTLGLRNVQSTLGVHKCSLDFELPNGKRFGTKPSQLPEVKNPNFLQTLKVAIDVPTAKIFAPTLNIEIRDALFGGLIKRLLGNASLDLSALMEEDGRGGWKASKQRLQVVSDAELAEEASLEKEAALRKKKEQLLKQAQIEEERAARASEARQAAEARANQDADSAGSLPASASAFPDGSAGIEGGGRRKSGKPKGGSLSGQSSKYAHVVSSSTNAELQSPLLLDGDSESHREEEEKTDETDAPQEVEPSGLQDSESKVNFKIDFKNDRGEVLDVNEPESKEDAEEQPAYMAGRLVVDDELEDNMAMEPFNKIPLYTGKQQPPNSRRTGSSAAGKRRQVGVFKGLVRLVGGKDEAPEVDTHELLNPKDLYLRLYVLRAYKLAAKDDDGKSDPYLLIKLGKEKFSTRDRYQKSTLDPEFYESFEIPCQIPGASQLEITLMDWDGIGDDLIGKTTIDIEDRWFTKDWRKLGVKPLERRTLHNPVSSSSQGKLELWLEILTPLEAKQRPMVDIKPPPPMPFELRVVIWGCKDCPIKDEITKQNDLYVTCHCSAPGLKRQQTDVHLRSKSGKGNFNWRMKFPIALPMKPWPRLRFQIWDKDFFSASDSICEQVVSLKGLCKKAIKKKDRVKIFDKGQDRLKLKGMRHPAFPKDKPATCEISVELIPEAMAAQLPAGLGRSDPNTNPFLPPPEGRINWSLFHPLDMLKELVGPELYRKALCGCCCILFLALLIVMAPMIFSNVISNLLVRG